MLFNVRIFKKIIKEAYNARGLLIAKSGDEYFLDGDDWKIVVKEKALAKELKAAVIELAGDLPESGEAFRATKLLDNQYEIPFSEEWRISRADDAVIPVDLTDVYIKHYATLCRVVQCREQNIIMDDSLIALVEDAKIDPRNESRLEGPFQIRNNGEVLYWYNNTCRYVAKTMSQFMLQQEKDIMEQLRGVNLDREENRHVKPDQEI